MTVGPAAGSGGRGHRCDRPNRVADPIPKSDARGAVLSVVRGTDDIFDLAVLGAPGRIAGARCSSADREVAGRSGGGRGGKRGAPTDMEGQPHTLSCDR